MLYANGNHKPSTIAQYAMKSLELSIKDFYCVFVCTEMNLIAFLGPSHWVNTQYAALSGAMMDETWAHHFILKVKQQSKQ